MTVTSTPIVMPLPTGQEARPGYAGGKVAHLARLRKIEGQVRGVARMIDQDRYCIDVLTQISAATKALQQVALSLVDDHVRHCVLDAARTAPDQGAATLNELAATLHRMLRI